MALNYGSRQEIINSIKKLKKKKSKINEKNIKKIYIQKIYQILKF